jgi:hypothetical protein
MLTFDKTKHAVKPTCPTKDGMRRMKRVSIELRHREVTITMVGSALHGMNSQRDDDSPVTVCPTCGSPDMGSTAWTREVVSNNLDRISEPTSTGEIKCPMNCSPL